MARIGGDFVPIKFDPELTWFSDPSDPKNPDKNGVEAAGPLSPGEEIKEICAWVYQRSGGNEAAATEMTTTPEGKAKFEQSQGRWKLPLAQISETNFREAPAFAVAMALLLDASGNENVVWWGHPVELKLKKT